MKSTFQVGGVPEHFNYPWQVAIERGKFKPAGLTVKWSDYPGGTGAMCSALREGKLDIAILLTEGITTDIIKGNSSKIVQFYVNSPLRWGIHVGAQSSIQHLDELKGKKYAISRFKSGSHLMSFVHASQYGWQIQEDDFELVKDLTGAREALSTNGDLAFLWEKFTTRPFVDNGELRYLGECKTPWPCFVVAVREEVLENNADQVRQILRLVNETCREVKNDSRVPEILAWRYNLKLGDAREWFNEVEWTGAPDLKLDSLEKVLNTLCDLRIIEQPVPVEELTHPIDEQDLICQ
ncbi:ABC transporter substrate-binding protein [bacterium SCSIO 12741]|nr:ABC transporter substrate-binding protein [bacterium SCSIO 12741]